MQMFKSFFLLAILPAGLSQAAVDPAVQSQLDKLYRVIAIQEAHIQKLEQQKPVLVSTTRRPGDYGTPVISIAPRKSGEGAAEMPKFGDTAIQINEARKVFVSATVSFRPIAYASVALGAAVTARKGDKVVVLHDSLNPLKSMNRGSGDGPYNRPVADAYTTIPVSGILELPEAGEWTLQILIENGGAEPVVVHTYSLTGIAI